MMTQLQKKGAPITENELTLAKDGNYIEFWRSRYLAGDPVARTALIGWGDSDFVNAGLVVRMAASYTWNKLSSYISENRLSVSMEQIGAELALSHAGAVMNDSIGIQNHLSPSQVAEYHHSVFRSHDIPPYIFGGTHAVPLTPSPTQGGWGRVMFDANTYSDKWCNGCDVKP